MSAVANTFKFSTLMWLLAGVFVPLWPISLPVCWFIAYRTYKGGTPLAEQIVVANAKIRANEDR